MGDDGTQGQEDTAWSAFDDVADSSLPSATFDEPLVWPESPAWEGEPAAGSGEDWIRLPEPVTTLFETELDADSTFPPESDIAVAEQNPPLDLDSVWQATDDEPPAAVYQDDPLGGLGGGGSGTAMEPAESTWTGTPPDSADIGLISTSAHSASPVYAAAGTGANPPWWRRVDMKGGNAAMIGLISLVSLVLLGMFLSVRARNDVPTDSSRTRQPSDDIAATGPLNTIPLTTTVTTTAPGPVINIADLLPPADVAPETGERTTGPVASRSPATAAPAPRATGSSGGGGGGGSTTPATSAAPAATSPPAVEDTAPPDTSPSDTSPPPTSPPVTDTQPPPTSRTTTTMFVFPSIPDRTAPPSSSPPFTMPTFPGIDD